MTWKQIKEEMEKLGIKDKDEITWIDTGPQGPSSIYKDRYGNYQIT